MPDYLSKKYKQTLNKKKRNVKLQKCNVKKQLILN